MSYYKVDEWLIIEDGLNDEKNKISESIFSIANGQFGQRACFEEDYSGNTMSGNYVAGVYYPDKTKVGWWKNGYPEYFAKVLNACNWNRLSISIDDEILDLNKMRVLSFQRILDMKTGILKRTVLFKLESGKEIEIQSERFCNYSEKETAQLKYSIKSNDPISLNVASWVDFDVMNEDSNYDEKFWLPVKNSNNNNFSCITAKTKKTDFYVSCRRDVSFYIDDKNQNIDAELNELPNANYRQYKFQLNGGEQLSLYSNASILSSMNYSKESIHDTNCNKENSIDQANYEAHKNNHIEAWARKWYECDIKIDGDASAQQGIRFNIFHLYQTYTGEDARLNIGPKGFTGEKYGGSTYWDTEAYCLPFYLATADSSVAKNLLKYRHNHLERAIENAEKLGFNHGAALYPMVTMNGEECHNEWEITFEEIHRNGAIAYAIYDYTRYTQDDSYLKEYGIEVLIAIARFWEQRVNWSKHRNQYVMLGVTGPNEYENNVNNNWYTNYLAKWCLSYCLEMMERYDRLYNVEESELDKWKDIIKNIYLPYDEKLGVYLQQDGFLDKDLRSTDTLKESDRPLNQNWSWDRILRSCFIKQADVLQGIYFFEEDFSHDEIKRNFDFYEPMTVHESSLSPCLYSIIANKLGYPEKAYELYLRTARLDLDNYNNDTEDGLHITSMAGTWMTVVKGFAGMSILNNKLSFKPRIPEKWHALNFILSFRGRKLEIHISSEKLNIKLIEGSSMDLIIYDKNIEINTEIEFDLRPYLVTNQLV